MAFVKLPGSIGKLYVPEAHTAQAPKHPCPDCFCCQRCGDERCAVCRQDPSIPCRKAGPTSRAPGPGDPADRDPEAAEEY
jgi:hypothetical protein